MPRLWAAPAAVTLNDPAQSSGYYGPQVQLAWSQSSENNFASYKLYRATHSGVTPADTLLATKTYSSDTSYYDYNLSTAPSPGLTYYYRVFTTDQNDQSSGSNEKSVTLIDAPPTAAVLSAPQPGYYGSSVQLSWTRSSDYDLASYRLYRATHAGVTEADSLVATINAQNAYGDPVGSYDYNAPALPPPGLTYYYRVFVIDNAGQSTGSNEQSLLRVDSPPAAVTLSPLSQSNGYYGPQVQLVWSQSSENDFSSYTVYRATHPGVTTQDTLAATQTYAGYTQTSDYNVPAAPVPGITYYYKVFVTDQGGQGTGSNEQSIALVDAAPAAVTLAAPQVGYYGNQVQLNWTRSSDSDLASYRVYRATHAGVSEQDTLVATVNAGDGYGSSVSSYDSNAPATPAPGTRYYYRVFAVDNAGQSTGSNEESLLCLDSAPSAVTLNQPQAGYYGSQVQLSWTRSSEYDIATYKAYRATHAGVTMADTLVYSANAGDAYGDPVWGYDSNAPASPAPGATYYYRVFVTDSSGQSTGSNEKSLTLLDAAPSAVTLAVPTSYYAGYVQLNWTRNYEYDLASYRLYRATHTGVTEQDSLVATVNAQNAYGDPISSYDSLNGATGTFYYRVFVIDQAGQSTGSNEVVYSTGPDAPAAPTFSQITDNSVRVTLPALPGGAATLTLQQKPAGSSDANYVTVAAGLAGNASVNVTGLVTFTTYAFRAIAVNTNGEKAGPAAEVTPGSDNTPDPTPTPTTAPTATPTAAPTATPTPASCPAGTHWEEDQEDCALEDFCGSCVPDAPDDCLEGYYWDEETQSCQPENHSCASGEHWDEAEQTCVSDGCSAGEYWDETAQSCQPDSPDCPSGEYWDAATQSCQPDTPTSCPEGESWDEGTQSCVENIPECSSGQYWDEETLSCQPDSCPPGTYWNEEVESCIDDNFPCQAGEYWNESTQSCQPALCPQNQHWDESTQSCQPDSCPEGEYWDDTTQSCRSDFPGVCSEGQYWDESTQSCQPDLCVSGEHWNESTQACETDSCPEGEYWDDFSQSCQPVNPPLEPPVCPCNFGFHLSRLSSPSSQSGQTCEENCLNVAAPSVSIDRGNSSATLSWPTVANATDYKIYRSPSGNYLNHTTETSFTQPELNPGTTACFTVRASYSSMCPESADSNTVCWGEATPTATPTSGPTATPTQVIGNPGGTPTPTPIRLPTATPIPPITSRADLFAFVKGDASPSYPYPTEVTGKNTMRLGIVLCVEPGESIRNKKLTFHLKDIYLGYREETFALDSKESWKQSTGGSWTDADTAPRSFNNGSTRVYFRRDFEWVTSQPWPGVSGQAGHAGLSGANGTYYFNVTPIEFDRGSNSLLRYPPQITITVGNPVTFPTPTPTATPPADHTPPIVEIRELERVAKNLNKILVYAHDSTGKIKDVKLYLNCYADNKWWGANGWQSQQVDFPATWWFSGFWKKDNATTPPLPAGANLPTGKYVVYAMATDLKGNVGYDQRDFQIDKTAPLMTIAEPAPKARIFNRITDVKGGWSDVGTGSKQTLSEVRVFLSRHEVEDQPYQVWNADRQGWDEKTTADKTTWPSLAAEFGSGWWELDSLTALKLPPAIKLPAGGYTVSVEGHDESGNIGQASQSFTVVTDNADPSVAITTPATGSTIYAKSSSAPRLATIAGTAGDAGGGLAKVEVRLYCNQSGTKRKWDGVRWQPWNGTLSTTDHALPTTLVGSSAQKTWSVNGALPQGWYFTVGQYTAQATATDLAGNETSVTSRFKVAVDTTTPTLSLITPVTGNIAVRLAEVSGTASDGLSGIDRVELTLYQRTITGGYIIWSGSGWKSTTESSGTAWVKQLAVVTPNASGTGVTWKRTAGWPTNDDLSAHEYVVRARAFDKAGNVSPYATATVKVQRIAKMQYSLDGGTSWQNVPQAGQVGYPLTIDQEEFINFKAIRGNSGWGWPSGKPLWSGDGEVEGYRGEMSWPYFEAPSQDSNDLKTVTAECGNAVSAKIGITGIPLVLESDVEVIAAGGVSSPIHKATVTATYQNTYGHPLAGRVVTFSYRYPDQTAFSTPINVTTGPTGKATFVLTSGQSTGDILVRATCEGEQTDMTISAEAGEAGEGVVEVISPNLIADGISGTDVTLHLRLLGQAVDGHTIAWRISRVTDQQGNEVQPDAQGAYPGYGSLSSPTGVTDGNGVSTIHYTTGTNPGIVTFDAVDMSVFVNEDNADAGALNAASMSEFAAAEPDPSQHPTYQNKSEPSETAQRFTISGRVTKSGKPVANTPVGWHALNGTSKDFTKVMTDKNGDYTLTNIPIGTWFVTVTDLETFPHNLHVTVSNANRTGQNFTVIEESDLLHPELSQSASDALRRAGMTRARLWDVISSSTGKPHYGTHIYSGVERDPKIGNHRYGNAIDIRCKNIDPSLRFGEVKKLRAQGFAAFYRHKPGNLHYHIVWPGSRSRNALNGQQIRSFVRGWTASVKPSSWEDHPVITQPEIAAVRAAWATVYPISSLDKGATYGGPPKGDRPN